MDYIGGAVGIAEKVGEVFGDYKRGRSKRLGSYNVRQFGHYDQSGKLGIYHGP